MRTMQGRLSRLMGIGIVSLALAGCLSVSREERPIHTFILSLDTFSWRGSYPCRETRGRDSRRECAGGTAWV